MSTTFSSLRITAVSRRSALSNKNNNRRDVYLYRRHVFNLLILYCLLLHYIPMVVADLLNTHHGLRSRSLSVANNDISKMTNNHNVDRPNSLLLVPVTVKSMKSSLLAQQTKATNIDHTISNMWGEYVPLKEQMELQHQLQCDDIQNNNITPMSDWTITELNSSDYFNQYLELSDLLQGSALRHSDTLTEAVCEFRSLPYSKHFPHVMQQLYRCWSWWQSNPHLPKVLIWKDRKFPLSDYIQSFLDILEKDEQVRLTVTNTTYTGFTVSSKDTGRWLDDIPITDFALLKPEHASDLSKVFQRHIDTSTFRPGGCHVRSNNDISYPKILILNRTPDSKRTIVDSNILLDQIQHQFPGISVREIYFENNVTYIQQVQYFMESDIIISPHGAQLTGIIFQPTSTENNKRCSQLLELLPKDYLVADYFGSLAKAAGIRHSFFYMDNESSRQTAIPKEHQYHYFHSIIYRDTMNCLNITKVIDAVKVMVYDWQKCCLKTSD